MLELITCKPGLEKILTNEIKLYDGQLSDKGRGWITVQWTDSMKPSFPDLCFSQTILGNPSLISAPSVNALAETCADLWMSHITDIRLEQPWHFSFSASQEDFIRRAETVQTRWSEIISKRMSRVMRLGRQGIPYPGQTDGFFVHFVDFEKVYISYRAESGGQKRMQMDPLAPSRSYLKMEEALHILGRSPGLNETVVDLGAAPGGWSWSALTRGAWVIAVDNGPLKGEAKKHINMTHLTSDAFSYQPDEPADWLLCDMIESPDMILNLLEKWLSRKWCRHCVVNLKVGRTDPVAIIRKIRDPQGLSRFFKILLIKQLHHDREEITLMGSL